MMSGLDDRLIKGAKVRYHGSLASAHGIYYIAGECCCRDCVARLAAGHRGRRRYALAGMPDGHPEAADLWHVRPRSLTPLNSG